MQGHWCDILLRYRKSKVSLQEVHFCELSTQVLHLYEQTNKLIKSLITLTNCI